jgi:ribosomal protein L7/L12
MTTMENLNFSGNQDAAARLDEIASLLRAGKKLNAIKVYRAVTGASLADAKAAIERMEQAIQLGIALVDSDVQPPLAPAASAVNMNAQGALLVEIELLLAQRKKIQAIKLYREHTGLGLADAKNAVDQIERTMRT